MRNGKIVLIEDDHETRVIFRQALECEGYEVLTAANGRAGLDLMDCIDRPSLILLDMMMPVMDGREVLRSLKQDDRYREVPVVLISAHAAVREAREAKAFLPKPVQLNDLIEVARHYCADQRSAA